MNCSDIGSFFIDKDGDVWEMKTYCEHPTCGLYNIKTGRSVSVVPWSALANDWKKLVPEDKVDVQE